MEGKTRSHKFLSDIGVNTHDQIDAYIQAGASKVLTSVVRNQTGQTLTKGTVVYVSGASGNKPLVSKAQANSEVTSSKTYGVVKEDISTNSNGEAVFIGEVVGLNTLAYAEGSILWLSPTVAGGFTTTKPVAPNHSVYVALVTRSHQNQGAIEVRIANGYELEELHNVLITNPTNGQVIAFDSVDSLYKNITLTKASVGLSNVDNTSDLSKPVSTATQTALDSKQATLVSGTTIKTLEGQSLLGSGNIDLTKNDVGLSNVDNTSDANKIISNATQAALDLRVPYTGASTTIDCNRQGIVNYNGAINVQTGTTYTLVSADSGRVISLDNAAAITVTIPSGLGAGFNCSFIQKGAGVVTFSTSGTTLVNRLSHNKTAGQHSLCGLFSDVSNNFYLIGDTST